MGKHTSCSTQSATKKYEKDSLADTCVLQVLGTEASVRVRLPAGTLLQQINMAPHVRGQQSMSMSIVCSTDGYHSLVLAELSANLTHSRHDQDSCRYQQRLLMHWTAVDQAGMPNWHSCCPLGASIHSKKRKCMCLYRHKVFGDTCKQCQTATSKQVVKLSGTTSTQEWVAARANAANNPHETQTGCMPSAKTC